MNYVVPVMLGVLVAKTVADGLEKKGIYELPVCLVVEVLVCQEIEDTFL